MVSGFPAFCPLWFLIRNQLFIALRISCIWWVASFFLLSIFSLCLWLPTVWWDIRIFSSTWAALKKCHSLDGLNNKITFQSSVGWKFNVKAPAWSVSVENSVPSLDGHLLVVSSHDSEREYTFSGISSYKGTNSSWSSHPYDLISHLLPSKDPISRHYHIGD